MYGKTRAEVAKKLAKALSDQEAGLVLNSGNRTVGEYLERWLADSVKDTVRQRTFERHEQIVRLHIVQALLRPLPLSAKLGPAVAITMAVATSTITTNNSSFFTYFREDYSSRKLR